MRVSALLFVLALSFPLHANASPAMAPVPVEDRWGPAHKEGLTRMPKGMNMEEVLPLLSDEIIADARFQNLREVFEIRILPEEIMIIGDTEEGVRVELGYNDEGRLTRFHRIPENPAQDADFRCYLGMFPPPTAEEARRILPPECFD